MISEVISLILVALLPIRIFTIMVMSLLFFMHRAVRVPFSEIYGRDLKEFILFKLVVLLPFELISQFLLLLNRCQHILDEFIVRFFFKLQLLCILKQFFKFRFNALAKFTFGISPLKYPLFCFLLFQKVKLQGTLPRKCPFKAIYQDVDHRFYVISSADLY